jgi:phosphohistidine phosphatase
MRTLYLMRHAKSDWSDTRLSDRERPLSARGERDAPAMVARLHSRNDVPHYIVTSPARRARMTAEVVAGGRIPLVEDADMYGASVANMIHIIQNIPDDEKQVMLVGHNPCFSELLAQLTQEHYRHMPTAAIAKITFKTTSWTTICHGNLDFFDWQKNTSWQ